MHKKLALFPSIRLFDKISFQPPRSFFHSQYTRGAKMVSDWFLSPSGQTLMTEEAITLVGREVTHSHTHSHTHIPFTRERYIEPTSVPAPPPHRTGPRVGSRTLTCARAVGAGVRWRQRVPLALAKTPHRRLLVDAVFIDGVYVVLRRLQSPQLGAQVAVLAAVRGPGPG